MIKAHVEMRVPMSSQETHEPAADDTPLLDLFGDTARARILSVLVGFRNRELNVSEIARKAGVTRQTVYDNLEALQRAGAIIEHETARGSRYTLSEDRVGETLVDLDFAVLEAVQDAEEIE